MDALVRGDGRAPVSGPTMASTSLRIRRADLRADEGAIRALLARNLPAAASERRYAWLYLGNPEGPALVWIAEDAASGEPVGTSAAHAREVRVDGRPFRALNLSDFAVDAAHRSLGPALQLLRATLEPVRAGEFAFSYDLPSRSMAAIYKRLGGLDLGPMVRLALPLAAAPVIRRRLGEGIAARLLGAVGDLALGARDLFRTAPRGVDVGECEGEWGSELDRLDAALALSCRVRAARGSRQLRWRFGPGAAGSPVLLLARRAGEPVGFAIARELEPGVHSIADFGALDATVGRALVHGLVARARAADAVALSAQTLRASPVTALLVEAGLTPRGEGPGPVVVAHASAPTPILAAGANWCILDGDGDV